MYRRHLNKDKKLRTLIKAREPYTLTKENYIYLELCSSIISQQLSVKVARIIYARFLALCNKKNPKPKDILALPIEALRAIGLSNAKAGYVHNVCAFFIAHKITDAQLHTMEDEAVIELLTQIKGIGRWTVEMILMFSLGREDVFAQDDLGIQQAMIRLYGLDGSDKKKLKQEMNRIADAWKPYRTYACRHLWNWKDNTPLT